MYSELVQIVLVAANMFYFQKGKRSPGLRTKTMHTTFLLHSSESYKVNKLEATCLVTVPHQSTTNPMVKDNNKEEIHSL